MFETVLNDFVSKYVETQNIFLFFPSHCDRELIVLIKYYFQIWKKKEHIIISRGIKIHISLMYIETLCIYGSSGQKRIFAFIQLPITSNM